MTQKQCRNKFSFGYSETGSIMLEVVAVLALMGVMGAMLFRQIYQRNQELHNIQMASEIRTVKEGFSAYIQANYPSLLPACGGDESHVVMYTASDGYSSSNIAGEVATYLPDGWFTAGALGEAYNFSLWCYKQSTGKVVVYGIVAPKSGTLPSSGWNFRRAARVALLIGADGAAYDSTITDGQLAGALGAWHIPLCDTGGTCDGERMVLGCSDDEESCSTYAAVTSQDIFSPEYDHPDEGKVAFQANPTFSLKSLHAREYLGVGQNSDCYEQKSTIARSNIIQNDDVRTPNDRASCTPIFWVGTDENGSVNEKGNVFVRNDLYIGADNTGFPGMKITGEGQIIRKDGFSINHMGMIIQPYEDRRKTSVSELPNDYATYMLDLPYTSIMNDIRLVSRGGARLSDILPNYILKNIVSVNGEEEINVPSCPKGYKSAITVLPVTWDNFTGSSPMGKTKSFLTSTGTAEVNDTSGDTRSVLTSASTQQIAEGVCVKITYESASGASASGDTEYNTGIKEAGSSGSYKIIVGMSDNNNDCSKSTNLYALAHVYCLYNGDSVTDGGTGGNAVQKERFETQDACEGAGYPWIDGICRVPYGDHVAAMVRRVGESDSDYIKRRKATCESFGGKWTPPSGSGDWGSCNGYYFPGRTGGISSPS